MAEPALRSALIVAVPEAAAAIDEWRERTSTAKPSNGVPAHVTIVIPFVPPRSIDSSLIRELRRLFDSFASFAFVLRVTARFPDVLYLAPEPAGPFVDLSKAVAGAYPEFPPYEGAFDSIVPHVTAAEGAAEILDEAEAEILPRLPITAEAHEVLLIEEVEPVSARWRIHTRLPLRAVQ